MMCSGGVSRSCLQCFYLPIDFCTIQIRLLPIRAHKIDRLPGVSLAEVLVAVLEPEFHLSGVQQLNNNKSYKFIYVLNSLEGCPFSY